MLTKGEVSKVVENDKGIAIIFIIIGLFALIGLLGLGIDVGYMYVIKGQLQKAADAGALAGAQTLYQGFPPSLSWASAETNATTFVQKNTVNGVNLTDAQVIAGYWRRGQDPSIPPSQAIIPTINDLPAVQVTVSKSAGNNGGPVPAFFARILGQKIFSLSARAVAGVQHVATMKGGVLPVAILQAFANSLTFNSGRSGQLDLTPDVGVTCKWTTLNEGSGANTVRDLTNPDYVLNVPISIGDSINNATGVKNTLFNDIDAHRENVVLFPVLGDFSSNKIVGFIPFYIISAQGGPTQTITGFFLTPVVTKFGGGSGVGVGGVNYQVLAPALVH